MTTALRALAQQLRSIWPAIILWLSGSACYSAISLYRHAHLRSNGYDLGIFDQTIWGYSHFRIISNTVRDVPNLLGDHFHPILMLIAIPYWAWNDVRTLLIVQALLIASAVVPIYLYGRGRIGRVPTLIIGCAYLIFWGVVAAISYDFHEVAFAAPLLAWALYGLLSCKSRITLIASILLLLTKEDLALTVAAIGLYALVLQKRWRFGSAVMGVALLWFGIVLKFIIPYLSGHAYAYWTYTALGSNPLTAVKQIVLHPIHSLQMWFEPPKSTTIARVFKSWGLLPLLSPITLLAIPTFAERFWSSNTAYWGTSYQYSLVLGLILAFATIDTMCRLGKRVERRRLRSALMLAAAIAVLALGAFYSYEVDALSEVRGIVSSKRAAEINRCLAVIPSQASVSASSAIIPHLTHRAEIYALQPSRPTDYIVIDVSTSTWPLTKTEAEAVGSSAQARGYTIACHIGATSVYARQR